MYVRTENGDLPRVEEGNTGSTPVYSTNLYAALAQVVRALGWTRRKPREVVSATLTCRTNL